MYGVLRPTRQIYRGSLVRLVGCGRIGCCFCLSANAKEELLANVGQSPGLHPCLTTRLLNYRIERLAFASFTFLRHVAPNLLSRERCRYCEGVD